MAFSYNKGPTLCILILKLSNNNFSRIIYRGGVGIQFRRQRRELNSHAVARGERNDYYGAHAWSTVRGLAAPCGGGEPRRADRVRQSNLQPCSGW